MEVSRSFSATNTVSRPVVVDLAEVTPDWLTGVLRRADVLKHGEVLEVSQAVNDAFNSNVTHLLLTLSTDAPPDVPDRLLLKRNLPEPWARRAGARETAFYQLAAALPFRLPMIVRCFDAVHDEISGNSHILLQDLSATHHPPLTREDQIAGMVPVAHELHAVVDALADFHAALWQYPRLGTGVACEAPWWATYALYTEEIRRREAAWTDLITTEEVPATFRRRYEDALAGLPMLWERFLKPRGVSCRHLTITHNDVYFTNFLCPNQAEGATFLIDWQGATTGRATDDLANLMTTFWTSAQRGEMQRETRLLRRYYERLLTASVRDYSWSDLLLDYRISVVEWLFVPAQDRADGATRAYWWPKLQCLLEAFQDLNCATLFRP
jgi:hypothetical protein